MNDLESLAYALRPYMMGVVNAMGLVGAAGGGGGGTSDPLALYTDGSRSMSASLNMGGNAIVNVGLVDSVDVGQLASDFAAHVAAVDPHPQYLTQAEGDALYVPLSRTVTAGAGLTGGGALSANISLALASSVAGAGLTFNTGVVNVGAGAGLTVNADDVALTTPGTLSVASTNNASGNHTHAVTSSSNPGAAASILASDAAGYLQLVRLGAGIAPVVPLHVAGGSEQLRVAYDAANYVSVTVDGAGDLTVAATGTRLMFTDHLQHPSYASQTTGWRVSNAGEGDFRYLFADELHAKSFIADLEQALAGGQIISKSVAMLASAFTAPATSSGGSIAFVSASGNAGTTNSLNVTAPGSMSNGHVMLCVVAWWNETLTMPGGWTQIGTTQSWVDGNGTHYARAYYRVASSEPGSYTFGLSASDDISVDIGAWSGVDATTQLDVTPTARTNSTASTSITADGLTTATNGAMLVFLGAAIDDSAGGDAITVPGGMTSRRNATNGTWVRTVIAEEARPTAGATGNRVATLGSAEANAAFLVALRPAPSNTTSLHVRDLPSAANMAVFESGDYVLVRQFSRAGGSLSITNCWGTVSSYVDGTAGEEGTQRWTFTRLSGSDGGAMAAGTVIAADALVLDFGVSGNGYLESTAVDGVYGLNSPYHQIVSWTTHPQTGRVVRTRLGNLRGIFGAGNEYGLYAGDGGTGLANQFVRASSTGFEVRNLDINVYNGGAIAARIERTTPYLSLGNPAPTSHLGGTGFWVGNVSGTYRAHLGSTSAGSLTRGLSWDGTQLTIATAGGNMRIDDTGLGLVGGSGTANSIIWRATTHAGNYVGTIASARAGSDSYLSHTAYGYDSTSGVIELRAYDVGNSSNGALLLSGSTRRVTLEGLTAFHAGTAGVFVGSSWTAPPTSGIRANGNVETDAILLTYAGGGGSASGIQMQSATPSIGWYENDAAADNRWWDMAVSGEAFLFRVVNDANSAAGSIMTVQRTGTAVDSIALGAYTVISGLAETTGSSAGFAFANRSGAATAWLWYATSDIARLWTSSAGDRLTVDNVGNVIASGVARAAAFQTVYGSVDWELGGYTGSAPSATGYVSVRIGGTVYRLLAAT